MFFKKKNDDSAENVPVGEALSADENQQTLASQWSATFSSNFLIFYSKTEKLLSLFLYMLYLKLNMRLTLT